MSEVKELVEFDKIAAGIATIQDKGNFIPDMSTKEGYQASKRFVLDETTPTRTRLDKAHKTTKEYWKLGGQNVDKKKNEILDLLVDIQRGGINWRRCIVIAKLRKMVWLDNIDTGSSPINDINTLEFKPLTPPIELINGKAYQFNVDSDECMGIYHSGKLYSYSSIFILRDCTNIQLLEVK